MLGDWRQPEVQDLGRLIDSQSKSTVAAWCVSYAETRMLPIYERAYPSDTRPRDALAAARAYIADAAAFPELKAGVSTCHAAAKEAERNPAAQAAARATAHAASAVHALAHSLGLALYGTTAVAYGRAGTEANAGLYDRIAKTEFDKMEETLFAASVENEKEPSQVDWRELDRILKSTTV